jgi:KaiC/GvpD/RAD55 family RecA-like ATPase
MSGTRVSTGVPIADDLLGGGVARGSPVLVRAHPLVDVFKLGVQFLRFRLEQGDLGLYFVNNKPPTSVVEESDSIGQGLGKFKSKGKLAFIDGYSGLFGFESNESFSVDRPMEPRNISDVVSRAIMEKSKQGKVVLVLDSLNTLIDQLGDRILSNVSEWNKIGLVHDSVIYYLYTEWGYPTATSKAVASLFPDIIDLKTIERIVAGQVMTVSKTDGEIVERKSRRGKTFYGCSNYPQCDFVLWNKPLPKPCPKCLAPFTLVKTTKRSGTIRFCNNKDCNFKEPVKQPA